jgi:predicted O-methyltransferase YrrM
MYRGVLKERSPAFVYDAVLKRFEDDRAAIDLFLQTVRPFSYHEKFDKISKNRAAPGQPYLDNPWFAGGDARAAYGIVAACRPNRIIEIGSGNSTMFMRRAINDFSLKTQITSIDPAPRAEIDTICDTVIRKSVLDVDLDIFMELQAGDILFHDGSHLTLNGTDTVRLFLEILPIIRPGVIIHIHDICLPCEYTASFDRRGYSEQYMLAAALLYSRNLEVLLPLSYLGNQTLFEPGVSFWMRKKEEKV